MSNTDIARCVISLKVRIHSKVCTIHSQTDCGLSACSISTRRGPCVAIVN